MPPSRIDARIPRFGQAATGVLLLVAFVVDVALLVPLLGAILLLGAAFGARANLWSVAFRRVVVPLARIGPPARTEDPAPPRFANLVGGVFLAAASFALLALSGATAALVGWALALVVAALALVAATTGYCVGCEAYLLLAHLRGRRLAEA